MLTHTALTLALLLCVGAQSKVVLHGREDVRHQLNQVFDALSMLNHKVSQFDNQGISTSTYEQQVRREREDLYRVLYGLNIRKVDWGYGAPFQYSKEKVVVKDTGDETSAYGTTHFVYLKGAFSGSKPSLAHHDQVLTHIAGGDVALHLFHEDGTYEHVILGDVFHNRHARFSVVVPKDTFLAEELITGEYAICNDVSAPSVHEEEYEHPTEEDLISKFPQHKDIFRKVFRFSEHDVRSELKSAVHEAITHPDTYGHHSFSSRYNKPRPAYYQQQQPRYNTRQYGYDQYYQPRYQSRQYGYDRQYGNTHQPTSRPVVPFVDPKFNSVYYD